MDPSVDMDKLSYQIFSILESKFLFGYDLAGSSPATPATPVRPGPAGKVRILSIDAGDGVFAATALARLESALQALSADPAARLADFFDVAAGSGAGGALAAMLFTKSPNGRPLFSADDALQILSKNPFSIKRGIFGGIFRRKPNGAGGMFRRMFRDATIKDAAKPVLIPCYDLATGAPFLFSRADAVETDGYDFLMSEVCAATCRDPGLGAVGMRSVNGRTRIAAVGGGVAMGNPTAAAITHVLNNRVEFPFANGVEDLMVISVGEAAGFGGKGSETPSAAELVRIAGSGVADTVDQAVAMAFGHNRTSNYVRIQANGLVTGRTTAGAAEEMLGQRNVESVLFRGRKVSQRTNAERLEWFAGELVKEQERRKASTVPVVVVKPAVTPPRSSSATSTTTTTTTVNTASTSPR